MQPRRPKLPEPPNMAPETKAMVAALKAHWGAMTPDQLRQELLAAVPELAPKIRFVKARKAPRTDGF